MKSFTTLFCVSIWIEMLAETITDTLSMKTIVCLSIVLFLFMWHRRRRRSWWEDEHWH